MKKLLLLVTLVLCGSGIVGQQLDPPEEVLQAFGACSSCPLQGAIYGCSPLPGTIDCDFSEYDISGGKFKIPINIFRGIGGNGDLSEAEIIDRIILTNIWFDEQNFPIELEIVNDTEMLFPVNDAGNTYWLNQQCDAFGDPGLGMSDNYFDYVNISVSNPSEINLFFIDEGVDILESIEDPTGCSVFGAPVNGCQKYGWGARSSYPCSFETEGSIIAFRNTSSGQNTIAHEIGHFFGLFHTFGSNSDNGTACSEGDKISDTPFDESSCNLFSNNVMDYGSPNRPELISEVFTQCQKAKMMDILFSCRNYLCNDNQEDHLLNTDQVYIEMILGDDNPTISALDEHFEWLEYSETLNGPIGPVLFEGQNFTPPFTASQPGNFFYFLRDKRKSYNENCGIVITVSVLEDSDCTDLTFTTPPTINCGPGINTANPGSYFLEFEFDGPSNRDYIVSTIPAIPGLNLPADPQPGQTYEDIGPFPQGIEVQIEVSDDVGCAIVSDPVGFTIAPPSFTTTCQGTDNFRVTFTNEHTSTIQIRRSDGISASVDPGESQNFSNNPVGTSVQFFYGDTGFGSTSTGCANSLTIQSPNCNTSCQSPSITATGEFCSGNELTFTYSFTGQSGEDYNIAITDNIGTTIQTAGPLPPGAYSIPNFPENTSGTIIISQDGDPTCFSQASYAVGNCGQTIPCTPPAITISDELCDTGNRFQFTANLVAGNGSSYDLSTVPFAGTAFPNAGAGPYTFNNFLGDGSTIQVTATDNSDPSCSTTISVTSLVCGPAGPGCTPPQITSTATSCGTGNYQVNFSFTGDPAELYTLSLEDNNGTVYNAGDIAPGSYVSANIPNGVNVNIFLSQVGVTGCSGGTSISAPNCGTTTLCNPPEVMLTSPANGTGFASEEDFTLAWLPISGPNTCSGPLYQIEIGSNPDFTGTTLTETVTATSYTRSFTNPSNNIATFYWRVRSYRIAAPGTYSNYSETRTFIVNPASSTNCGAVTGLNVTNLTSGSATLNWNPVPGAISYTVAYLAAGQPDPVVLTVSGTSTNLTGLMPSTTYDWGLFPVCDGATGPNTLSTFSTPEQSNNNNSNNGGCGIPEITDLDEQNNGEQVRVIFNTVPTETDYTIRYRNLITGNISSINASPPSSIPPPPSSLTEFFNSDPGDQFEVWVEVDCFNGDQSRSVSDFITIPYPECDQFPDNLVNLEILETQATVSWEFFGNGQEYEVQLYSGDGLTLIDQIGGIDDDDEDVTFFNLSPNTEYTWRVRTSCLQGGASEWSDFLSFRTQSDLISVSTTQACTGEAVMFSYQGPVADNYDWQINNGIGFISSDQNTFYVFDTPGTYQVTLTTVTAGELLENQVTVQIGAPLNLTFDAVAGDCNASTLPELSVLVDDQAPNSDFSILWNTGETTATINPTADGTYTVTVTPTVPNCPTTASTEFTSGAGFTTYYQDLDGDGLGNPNVSVVACSQPNGFVTNADDCDDDGNPANVTITCPTGTMRSTDPETCSYLVQGTEFDALTSCPSASLSNDFNNGTSLAGASFPAGTTTVTWTAAFGTNATSCSFSVVVNDGEAPQINCAAINTTVATDPNSCTYTVIGTEFNPTFSDNCQATLTNDLNNSNSLQSAVFDLGNTTLTWTVTDNAGRSDQCTLNIIVIDTVAPIVSHPDTTLYLNESGLADLTVSTMTFDSLENCTVQSVEIFRTNEVANISFAGGAITAVDQQIIFDCDDVGTPAEILVVATDQSGNTDTTSFFTTVLDTISPVLTCRDTTVALNIDGLASLDFNQIIVSAQDACGIDTLAISADFSCADAATSPNFFTDAVIITDPSGNADSCTVSVTVIDTIAPVLACRDTTISLDADGIASLDFNEIIVSAEDACGVDTLAITADFSCDDVATSPNVFTDAVIITDPSGNADSCTVNVTVIDTIPPVLTLTPQTITLNEQGRASLDLSDIAEAEDACSIDTLFTSRSLDFECEDIGINVITVTAIDVNGNQTVDSVEVEVLFNEPALGCISEINVTLDEDCEFELVFSQVLAGNTVCLELANFEINIEGDLDDTNGAQIDGCGRFIYTITEVEIPGSQVILSNFDNCWGYVNAEDKTSPELVDSIEAPAELFCVDLDLVNLNTLPSNVSRCFEVNSAGAPVQANFYQTALGQRLAAGSANGLIPGFDDGCSGMEICVNDIVIGTDPCQDIVINRTFTARDGDCESVSGEENEPTVFTYQITFTRPDSVSIDAGAAEFECDDTFVTLPNGNPAPDADDFPFVTRANGQRVYLGTQGFCNLGATYQDGPRIETCANTYKFVRTWTVIDWCDFGDQETFTQLVKVGDFTAPVITAPTQDLDFNGIPDQGPLFFSTNTSDCEAVFQVPAGGATDNCDANPEVVVFIYPFGDFGAAPFGPYAVGGFTFGGIPRGTHAMRYVATDDCGNESEIDVLVTIGDATAPVAVCEDGLNISIGGPLSPTGDATVELCADDVDRASYDACSDIFREIRITQINGVAVSPFNPLNAFEECKILDCSLLGTIEVELRVTDDGNEDGLFQPGIDNSNTCWLDVLVEDKLAPVCIAPSPLTVTCADLAVGFPQDLNVEFAADPIGTAALLDAQFGAATGLDNCPGTTISQTVIDGRNSCGVGNITRSFTVTDAQMFTSAPGCTQMIVVEGTHDYTIIFPGDVGVDLCVDPTYNDVEFTENGCDLIAVSTSIDTFTATADECYKLRITYEVINWCEYNTIDPAYEIPRDADNDGNLDEITVVHVLPFASGLADDEAWLDRDINLGNGIIDEVDTGDGGILPGSDVAGYGQDGSRGAFEYEQFIKVYDDTPPTLVIAEPDSAFCSFASEPDCDADVNFSWTLTDECTTVGGDLSVDPFNQVVEVDAFIDLGSDGIFTLAEFVADFDVTDMVGGDLGVDPTLRTLELSGIPQGIHALRVRASDGCGNSAVDLIVFEVVDCKAPTPICINGLTATLMPDGPDPTGGGAPGGVSGMAAIWASDFIASPSTDCNGPVKFALYLDGEQPDVINPADTGLLLDCSHVGPQIVRVYAIDAVGNADYCLTSLMVQVFNDQVCGGPGSDAFMAGAVMTPASDLMDDVAVNISGDMTATEYTTTGLYQFGELEVGNDYTIEPSHNPDVNLSNVSTGDLIMISRHILGIATLEGEYQVLAADVTQDESINILDIIAIRRVILGLDAGFQATNSWRFYLAGDDNHDEVYNENNLQGSVSNIDFVAVEMGNVSDAIANNGLGTTPVGADLRVGPQTQRVGSLTQRVGPQTQDVGPQGNARGTESIVIEDVYLRPGERHSIVMAGDLLGFQGTLELGNGLELVAATAVDANATAFNLDNIASGLVAFSSMSGAGFELEVRATTDVKLSDAISLSDRVTITEAYTNTGTADLNLAFSLPLREVRGGELYQNIPNPFRKTTQISFNLPATGLATLLVQNQQGQVIREVKIDGQQGLNQINLSRADLNGATGVLTYTITSGSFTATRKMIVQ